MAEKQGKGNPQLDWPGGVALACRIDGRRQHTGAAEDDDHLFLIFNAGAEAQAFELPPNDSGAAWKLAYTTQEAEPALRPKGPPRRHRCRRKRGRLHRAVKPATA